MMEKPRQTRRRIRVREDVAARRRVRMPKQRRNHEERRAKILVNRGIREGKRSCNYPVMLVSAILVP